MSHTRDPGPARPYRVGMARATQRYIEPDEIYPDMSRGAATKMPAEFGWTWNPVNGLGAIPASRAMTAAHVDGFFDDIVKAGTDLVKGAAGDTVTAVSGRASDEFTKFLKSGPGQEFFDKIEDKATEGVTKVVKEQGVNLIMLAVAAGAVGGALSSKLGKTGTVLALLVGGFAANKILTAVAPPKKAK